LRGPSGRFEFQKRGQLFIRTHNETLSVAAMCVSAIQIATVASLVQSVLLA
jgi:hypothetical protein